jgi:hypothetical protein
MIIKYMPVIISFILGAVLSGVVPALAENRTIEAYYNNIKIRINGEFIEPDVEPCIINNRTFCPARFIAEPLGASVSFNETDNCIDIVSKKDDAPVIQPEESSTQSTEDSISITQPVEEQNQKAPASQYDNSGLPEGMVYVDYKGCKAIQYNTKIYISKIDMEEKFEFEFIDYFHIRGFGKNIVDKSIYFFKHKSGCNITLSLTNDGIKVNGIEYFNSSSSTDFKNILKGY